MFDKMPSWTDMCGAALVLGTVVIITFESQITSASCSKPGAGPPDVKVHTKKEAEKS